MSYVNPEKSREYAKNWYRKNRERLLADPERRKRNARLAAEWRKNHPDRAMFSAAKARAKRLGQEFSITFDDIVIPERCPIWGVTLSFHEGRQADNTPSLDRIDNSKGYIKGNVAVISHKANRQKSDLSLEAIENLYNYVKCLRIADA